ncbi:MULTISPECIES: hypothetical protein [unclassified Cryobacterium]|uniref:hypothetical protein n=1 Tax=unclassified Cryobacterium TaxID=2649013 RepID=UPI00106B287D|nr:MULTISPECIES: hypothetical protein [unclassified Cryobacterium]TFD56636.1 hypothetical protein E3T41_15760 [Cryobacterium sp. Hh38]
MRRERPGAGFYTGRAASVRGERSRIPGRPTKSALTCQSRAAAAVSSLAADDFLGRLLVK